MEARDLLFENIDVGEEASFDRTIYGDDVDLFAQLSGDHNPLHTDDEYAEATPFKKRVVHGMFLASLVSQLVGMHLPGKRCLLLSENLTFKKPVFIDDMVTVSGKVESKSLSTKILILSVIIMRDRECVVEGEVKAQVI